MRNIFRKFFKKNSGINSSIPPINSIIPLIRPKSWIDSYQQRIEETIENAGQHSGSFHEFGIVNQPFISDLYCVYAYNFLDGLPYLNVAQMKKHGFNEDSLHKLAISNVGNLSCEVKQISEEIFLLQADDISLTTSMIFKYSLWDEVSSVIKDDPIISISSYEAILIARRNSKAGIEELQKFSKGFASVDEKSLSAELYTRSNGKWVN